MRIHGAEFCSFIDGEAVRDERSRVDGVRGSVASDGPDGRSSPSTVAALLEL
jgi:hypothetical protein